MMYITTRSFSSFFVSCLQNCLMLGGCLLLLELFGTFKAVCWVQSCFVAIGVVWCFWNCLLISELFVAFKIVCGIQNCLLLLNYLLKLNLLDTSDTLKNFPINGLQTINHALEFTISNAKNLEITLKLELKTIRKMKAYKRLHEVQ